MYLIVNGQIVTEEGILNGFDLLIDGDRIKRIGNREDFILDRGIEVVDANNGYVCPGFVDIHSDYIETMAEPRPTSIIDFDISIRESEKFLINQGITTMFHSLTLCKDDEFIRKQIRKPENVNKLIDIIDQTHWDKHLMRHRFHARLEIDNLDVIEEVKEYIRSNKLHLLSFMDHSPGQGQYRDIEVYKKTLKAYRDISYNQADCVIQEVLSKERMTEDMIKEVATLAKQYNIAIASHDDDSIQKLEFVKSYGTSISEFPITLEVAKAAKKMGLSTIAGAPNVLMGGSHSGNMSAVEAIINNAIDIICSDYYPPAMLHAVFILHEKYGMDLCEMFNMVTINPARAVKMDRIIGSIESGKKADLLIIEKIENDYPVITSVFVDGKLVSKLDYRV